MCTVVYLCALFVSVLSGCVRLMLSRSWTRSANGPPPPLLGILDTQGS